MKTVWVIEQGTYSDYRVVGVFSDKASAQLIADKINKPDEDGYSSEQATLAEWPLNPAVDELNAGMHQYNVLMLANGDVEYCQCEHNLVSGAVRICRLALRGKGIKDVLNATVWATDDKHAIKIVNEHRARLIASGEFS